MSLHDELRDAGVTDDMEMKPSEPVWDGPQSNSRNGGVTFSILNRYLADKERYRLYVMEGLKEKDQFNHRLEYGNMWHLCEEIYAGSKSVPSALKELRYYAEELCKRYKMQREEIDKWYNVCAVQFPIYVDYWSKHPDTTGRTPLLQEYAFCVPYTLSSGRIVYLRGKWDSVDLIEEGLADGGIYLQENKTKGDIDQQAINRQLTYDLQTMIYITAYAHWDWGGYENESHYVSDIKPYKLKGVRYNVVRRPLSGGRGTIIKHKGSKNKPEETYAQYYQRLASIINGRGEDAPGPTHFFMRWKCDIMQSDIERFKHRTLNPILENLCDDYDWWDVCKKDELDVYDGELRRREFRHTSRHFLMPFGLYSSLQDGGETHLDHYIRTGQEAGLQRVTNLFPELQSDNVQTTQKQETIMKQTYDEE